MDTKNNIFFRNLIKWIIIFPTISCFISGIIHWAYLLLSIIMSVVFINVGIERMFPYSDLFLKRVHPQKYYRQGFLSYETGKRCEKKILYNNIIQNLAYDHVIFYANFLFWLVDIIKIKISNLLA